MARKQQKTTISADKSYTAFSDLKSLDIKNTSADMVSISAAELSQITELASDATALNRQDLKSQKYDVEALNNKRRNLKNNFDPNNDNGLDNLNRIGGDNQIDPSDGSGLNVESHPDLPYTGGKPADQIYFPESVIESGQIPESFLSPSQREELQKQKERKREKLEKLNKLANKAANKYKFKFAGPKNAPKIQPKQAPRIKPLPKPTPY